MASPTAGEASESLEVDAAVRDGDILEHIRTGNLPQAFDLVMQRYETKVYRLCVAYLRDPALAQDAAQESLVRVWRALSKYDGRAALSTWIYAITRNWCLTSISARRPTVSLSETAVAVEVDRIAVAAQTGPEQMQAIKILLDALPDVTRRIVTLYYFEEQSIAEVSDLVGLPQGTIKTHLFRARASLLTRIESLGLADPALWFGAGDRHDG
jgi:RNA polymerase sigma-70 factor (ECF subfamily)